MIGSVSRMPGRLREIRVLIAEDEYLVADPLAVRLEEEGARIVGPFAKAAEALACIRTEEIDFAIVDMGLDDNFADELIEHLVAQNIGHVIISGYDALPTNAGDSAIARFQKPIDTESLIILLGKHSKLPPA
jgi:ActR/RegA family two-component response regulator